MCLKKLFYLIEYFEVMSYPIFGSSAGSGFNTSYSGCNSTFLDKDKKSYISCSFYMCATAQLYRTAKTNNPDLIAIFLSKKSKGTHIFCLIHWTRSFFLNRQVLCDNLLTNELVRVKLLHIH